MAGKSPEHAPKQPKSAKTYLIRFAGHAGLAALFISVALLGILSGVMFAYAGDLPCCCTARRSPPAGTR